MSGWREVCGAIAAAKRKPVILKGPAPYELRDANRRPLDYVSARSVALAANNADRLAKMVLAMARDYPDSQGRLERIWEESK